MSVSFYDELTNDEKMLVNSEVQTLGKNVVVAYVLWFFLGMFGAHNFYIGRTSAGVTQLILSIVGYATLIVIVGFVFLFVVGVWVIIDLFTMHNEIERSRNELKNEKAKEILAKRKHE